jgi:hypothetical protein
MKTFILPFVLAFTALLAQDPVIYTIEGKKDPRLEARYIVSYVSTGISEECTTRKLSTGTRKPVIGSKVYEVKDENYSIKIPIALTEDENNCGYRIGGLELIMKRKNDDDQYSLFQLFGDYKNKEFNKELGGQMANVIYGFKGGCGSPTPLIPYNLTPSRFYADKKYFRITPKTTFGCVTTRLETFKLQHEDFTCMMQMQLDTEGGKYHRNICTQEEQDRKNDPKNTCGTVSNPDFGVDEITSDILHIDIIVDESKCYLWSDRGKVIDTFRELPKPTPSALESLKSLF